MHDRAHAAPTGGRRATAKAFATPMLGSCCVKGQPVRLRFCLRRALDGCLLPPGLPVTSAAKETGCIFSGTRVGRARGISPVPPVPSARGSLAKRIPPHRRCLPAYRAKLSGSNSNFERGAPPERRSISLTANVSEVFRDYAWLLRSFHSSAPFKRTIAEGERRDNRSLRGRLQFAESSLRRLRRAARYDSGALSTRRKRYGNQLHDGVLRSRALAAGRNGERGVRHISGRFRRPPGGSPPPGISCGSDT